MILQDKVAAVTGAGSGIGRAIALALAANGARVAVTDLNVDWAKRVAEEIEAAGGQTLAIKLDVTCQAEAQATVQAIVKKWGRLDVWANNAGVNTMNHFVNLTEEEWDFVMNVNTKGVFLCSQVAARQMIQQASGQRNGLRGKIINIASMAGKRGNCPFQAHYVASKFAVVGLTQAMACELAPCGVLVNAVCPGYVRTSMQENEVEWETKLRGIAPDEVRQLYINDTPLGRLETPDDLVGVVVFLASPAADFITGVSISVNGGSFMD